MNKKILGVIAIVVIAVVTALSVNLKSNDSGLSDLGLKNAEALANQNPACPNGCDANGNGCYCNGWYPCYLEHDHGD
jgi:hypothetical protein